MPREEPMLVQITTPLIVLYPVDLRYVRHPDLPITAEA